MSLKGFKAHMMKFETAGSKVLRQVDNVSVDPRIENLIQGGSSIDTLFAGAQRSIPNVTFDTPAIALMLGYIGLDGTALDTTDVYFAKFIQGGSLAGATSHVKFTIKQGLGILRSISARQGSEAIASYEVIGTYDGTNAAIAIAINQSLLSVVQSAEKYTVGPVILNTTPITVSSIQFNTGLTIVTPQGDGELTPRLAAISARRPSFTITSPDVEIINEATVDGSAIDDVDVFFRNLGQRGIPIADATVSHIKFTMVDALVTPGPATASADGEAEATIIITAVDDQVNPVLAVNLASAIA